MAYQFLNSINSPADIRTLPIPDLCILAEEIRAMLLIEVSKHGGHLAPSLGAVELALALHYVYDTPNDKLIWDVGHQSYAHKIITGRRDRFASLRQFGGISGFPRISESPYDTVSAGHASTSISVGLGIAMARDIAGEKHDVVSVIGDGSLSGGLAFEGLNNLGSSNTRMTVVVNDNKMSISKNVGALSRYLTRVITDRRFNKIKNEVWELLGNMSHVGKGIRSLVHNVDETLKRFVIPGKLFEDLGLQYLGPVDGHNIAEMIEVFQFVKSSLNVPVLVHVITQKGKGYSFAEMDSTKFHGVPSFTLSTGDMSATAPSAPKYSDVFGATLCECARVNKNIVAITAAMPDGTGLSKFRDEFPTRFFDVGIAESHAITFAAGLALGGRRPVVALYSSFVQRTFDQLVHDVALDSLPVILCIDRAGIVGDDGPTHHGMFDLSFLRAIPNLVMMAPRNENDLKAMIHTALAHNGPVCIRYPRGSGTGEPIAETPALIPIGHPLQTHDGTDAVLVSIGDWHKTAIIVREKLSSRNLSLCIVDARFAKPLNRDFYADLFNKFSHVITLESNNISAGFGSAVAEIAADISPSKPIRQLRIGLPDAFIAHGDPAKVLPTLGLDADSIVEKIEKFLKA